jgi:hypothetical protein
LRTIDLVLDILCDLTKPALDEAVPLEVFAEPFILVALVLSEPANLY